MMFNRKEADQMCLTNVAIGLIFIAMFLLVAFSDCGDFWRDTEIILMFLIGGTGIFQAFIAWLGVIEVNE